jgi:hypothetical protein
MNRFPSGLTRTARGGFHRPQLALRVVSTSAQRKARRLPALIRHGLDTPRFGERVWINPSECSNVITDLIHRRHSGEVRNGEWDRSTRPIESITKIRACLEHFVDGVGWADTEVYEHMLQLIDENTGEADGCRNLDDVVDRYRRLDEVFATIRAEGRFRTRYELRDGRASRRSEVGGVFVHIGHDLTPIFGGGSCHRLAVARILALPVIPAHLGVVHSDAIREWRTHFSAGALEPRAMSSSFQPPSA